MKRKYLTCFFALMAPGISFGAEDVLSGDAVKTHVDTLPDLEVTAERSLTPLNAGTPLFILSDKDISTRGISDIGDAMRRIAGINLRDYGGAGGLKTISVRGLGASHTGILYDGLPLSDIRSGEIDLSHYSLDNMKSLQLSAAGHSDIFLPARAVAGASSLNLTTVPNPEDPSLLMRIKMRAASFGTYNPFISIAKGNGRNFAWSATGEFTHADNDYPYTLVNGKTTTRERRFNSRMNAWHSEINANWTPQANSSLSAKAYYYDNNRQLPGPVIYYLTETDERLHDRNAFGQAKYTFSPSGKIRIMALGKFNWAATRYIDVAGKYPGGRIDQKYYQRETYAAAAVLYTPHKFWSLDYSADWMFNNLNSNLPTNTFPRRHTILQAVAGKYDTEIMTLTGRLLHTYASDASRTQGTGHHYTRLSPSLSISIKPIRESDIRLRASFRELYRLPTFNELYFDNYGTLNLDPEKTRQWNVGVTYSLSAGALSSLAITCDGYLNEISNKITAIPWNLFRWTMTNLGRVRILGIDASVAATVSPAREHDIELSATWNYQHSQIRTAPDRLDWHRRTPYTPLNSGSLSIGWTNPWVNVSAHATASSARYATANNLPDSRIDGYMDCGLTICHTFPLGKHNLTLRADLINAFNSQYQIVARYPMPGRAWQASIEWKMGN